MKKLSFFLLLLGTSLLGVALYVGKASAHPPYPLGHPRPTSYVCRRSVVDLASGTLANGNRYVVRQYSVDGDDFANAHFNEAGSVIDNTNPACGAANPISGAIWDNNGYIPTTSTYQWSGQYPTDVWLGTPKGYYPGPARDTGFGPRPPANVRGIYNASFGTHFAEVNDAAAARINGNDYYCVGMPTLFFPGCLGANAHLDEPLGCDCWGFLNDPNASLFGVNLIPNTLARALVNNNISLVGYYGITRNASGTVNPFKLDIIAMNTQDNGTYGAVPGPSWALKGSATLTFIYPPAPPPSPWDIGVSVTCTDQSRAVFTFTKVGTIPGNVSVNPVGVTTPSGAVSPGVPATLNEASFNGASSVSFQSAPTNLAFGQTYTATATVSPGGDVTSNNTANDTSNCSSQPVARSPYFKVFGGDAVVGGGFGATCAVTNPAAKIEAIAVQQSPGVWVGAGAQLAAAASGQISGFISQMRTSAGQPARPSNNLTFGNYAATRVPTFGGLDTASGAAGCIPDYLAGQTLTAMPTLSSMPNGGLGGDYYVDGDVYITDNIEFAPAALSNWTSRSSIPKFRLFVRGSINIDPRVTRLDGLYVAIPTGAGGGNINTCVRPGGNATLCGNKLTVFGAFVSKSIELVRHRGAVELSPAAEGRGSANIAEEFVYTPDLYLNEPAISNPNQPAVGGYNYIVGLPPVL